MKVIQVPGLRKNYVDIESMPESQEERRKVVFDYCPLVMKIAASFWKRGVPQPWTLADLFQEGVLYLHRAIRLWEPGRGRPFKTFAYMVVAQGLKKSVWGKKTLFLIPYDIMEDIVDDTTTGKLDDDDWVAALGTLTPKEGDIIIRRLGLDGNKPEHMKDIAADYGCSRQLIDQIEKRALKRLKRWFEKRKGA